MSEVIRRRRKERESNGAQCDEVSKGFKRRTARISSGKARKESLCLISNALKGSNVLVIYGNQLHK